MECRQHCGRKARRRKSGPLAGLCVCSRCGVSGPRPLFEAIRRNIPFDLWVLILRAQVASVDKGAALEAIERRMVGAYRAGEMSEIIEAERLRRIGAGGLLEVEEPEAVASAPKVKAVWRSNLEAA